MSYPRLGFFTLTLAIFLGLATATIAQIPSDFIIWPERNGSAVTYTSRSSNSGVELLQEVPGKFFAGVGDGAQGCQVRGIFHWATDENQATQESYHMLLRLPDPMGRPDATTTGLIMSAGPFNLPIGPGGRMAWRVQATFSTPASVPCNATFFMGVSLTPANWPTDGHSVWDAQYVPPMPPNFGDNPRLGAPGLVWTNVGGAVSGPFPFVHRIGLLVNAPVLNVGGIDPANLRQMPPGSSNYGAGGIFPDIRGTPRRDGLDVRVEHLSAFFLNSAAIVVLSPGITPTNALPVPGISGNLWLDTRLLLFIGAAPMIASAATVRVASPATLPQSLVGITVFFQGITIDSFGPKYAFTNVQGTSL